MNFSKDKKPSRPDIQEILSRMKSRFINEEDSDSEDRLKEENTVTTSVVESTVKEVTVDKSPDDEIAELMLKLNGQVDEELVASIRSRKKMYENQPEVDSTSCATYNSDQTEDEKPRIILTLRPNENKPDTYVSSSNLTEYSSNSPKRKKNNEPNIEVIPLKRSSRRSNDGNQSVLKSAIARKERTFSIDVDTKKRLPKKIKKETEEVINEVNVRPAALPVIEVRSQDVKEEISEEIITDPKKKKKKFFRGGRYNIFKKKSLQKERQKVVKKGICNQINSDSGNFDVESSETNSERHSTSVCSDIGTLMSSDKNDLDDMDNSLSTTDLEDKTNDGSFDLPEINLCLCNEPIQVIIVDEGKIPCKAEDCVDGKLILCKNLASHFDEYGTMPMLRANVNQTFLTFCAHHMNRFFLHHSCPRCGRFCTEGIFMTCRNKHFSHIGCHYKDKGCLHCGVTDVYELEIKRHVIKHKRKRQRKDNNATNVTVEVGNIKLTTIDCPPEIDVIELSKHLKQLKDEIVDTKRTMYSFHGLYDACVSNDIKKVLLILGAGCNLSSTFPSKNNQTALHAACIQGNLMLVYILLQAGVDPNLVDNEMKSPMRMAAKFGHTAIVQYLLNFNGAPEIKDVQGMTSLHLAAKHGKLDCCKIILNEQPSMVNWKDNGGWTPLVWACENSHVDVVKYFISHKPNTRVPDNENNVALHWAAISGCIGVVKSVVEYDPEVNMYNDAGDTALHIAARKNAFDIVSYLLEKGAMTWHKNKGKKRPIDCCLSNSKCYNILKNVPPEQRKSVTSIQPFTPVIEKIVKPKLNIIDTPAIVKTSPVIVSEDITHGCENVPIRCVNEIDDEVPVEFTYIKENCYDVGNYVDSAMSHITSCNCDGACNTSDCKCVQANGDCLYDENGRLNSDFDYFNPSVILFECNLRCKCHKQRCGNRVIQKGIKIELELFKHKYMGWGVRTLQPIPRGTFVCEYVGEIITDQKANDLVEDSYLFNLENPGANELFCIDAYNYSNVSRFINHSCDPNLMSVRSFINHHDKRFPRIAFFAVQDIKQNEQLCYDYGTTFWKIKGGIFSCKCGTSNCSFSEETINGLDIDSDSEETEVDGNTAQRKKRSVNKSLLEQNNGHTDPCSSGSSSKTLISINVFNNRKTNKNVSKRSLKIANDNSFKVSVPKLIQNNLQHDILKKGLGQKILSGNSNQAFKTVKIRNKSEDNIDKDLNCCNVTLKSVQLTNNNGVSTPALRRKVSNPNKTNIENIKTDGTVQEDVAFKTDDFRENEVVSSSSNISKSNLIMAPDLNSCDQLVGFIKTEPIYEESGTKLKVINGKHNFIECLETFEGEYDKLKSCEALDIKRNCNKESFSRPDQDDWLSLES